MQNYQQTIISQYANSPTLAQLIENMNGYLDPGVDLDTFYSYVWDIDTAQGFGLDIWGKIVGVNRTLEVQASAVNFGFSEGGSYSPFGQAPFYNGPVTGAYILGDDAYRTLILVKALANISDGSIASYNQLLKSLFGGSFTIPQKSGSIIGQIVLGSTQLGVVTNETLTVGNKVYVADLGNMQIQYVFGFYLSPVEVAILTQSNALPRPAGVSVSAIQVYQPDTFGFNEATGYQTFGNGTFALNPVPIA